MGWSFPTLIITPTLIRRRRPSRLEDIDRPVLLPIYLLPLSPLHPTVGTMGGRRSSLAGSRGGNYVIKTSTKKTCPFQKRRLLHSGLVEEIRIIRSFINMITGPSPQPRRALILPLLLPPPPPHPTSILLFPHKTFSTDSMTTRGLST